MNIVETATAVVTLFWIVLLTAYTILLHKRTDEIEKQAEADRKKLNVVRLTRVQNDMDDIAEGRKSPDGRTADAIKQHEAALRSLYEYAQEACGIRSNMLKKITDLEHWVQAYEARHIEQEEKQWKD